jgi:hypothetical protein
MNSQKNKVFEKNLFHMPQKTKKQKMEIQMKKKMYFFFMKNSMPKQSVYKAVSPFILENTTKKPIFFSFEKNQYAHQRPMNQ